MSALIAEQQTYPLRLDVRPLTPVIGAEIHGVDLRKPLAPATVQAIEQTLLQWKVSAGLE